MTTHSEQIETAIAAARVPLAAMPTFAAAGLGNENVPTRHPSRQPAEAPPARPGPQPGADLPASGAWFPEFGNANRLFFEVGTLDLEAGGQLPAARLAYQTWGRLNATASNAILIEHALTGDAHVCGEASPGQFSAGWWNPIVGPGKVIDTEKYFVVCANVIGGCQGSSGPASPAPDGQPWGSRFPAVTVRDQVAAEARLAAYLGVKQWHTVIGGSMGGHRALEWAVGSPQQVERLIVIASAAATSAEQSAWAHTQISAITLDPGWQGGDYYHVGKGEGPSRGLGLARQIAHTTYRSPTELDIRFGRIPQRAEDPMTGGRLAVQSYLDHHADKLARRFDAGSYVSLSRSMITHDIGRDRGGVASALLEITAQVLTIAVDSDRLFFPRQSWEIAVGVRTGKYREIHSAHGHDGFLIEFDQLEQILEEFFA